MQSASYANDGHYRFMLPFVAQTLYQVNPWWRVNLGDIYCVWAVNILNAGDGRLAYHVDQTYI